MTQNRAIGVNWWMQTFWQAVQAEEIDLGALERAKKQASRIVKMGQVRPGVIEAGVETPYGVYEVHLSVPPFTRTQMRQLTAYFARHPDVATEIREGYFAENVYQKMQEAGLGLFSGLSLGMHCECSAKKPCQHRLTVLARLLSAMDTSPGLYFLWRGFTLPATEARGRERRKFQVDGFNAPRYMAHLAFPVDVAETERQACSILRSISFAQLPSLKERTYAMLPNVSSLLSHPNPKIWFTEVMRMLQRRFATIRNNRAFFQLADAWAKRKAQFGTEGLYLSPRPLTWVPVFCNGAGDLDWPRFLALYRITNQQAQEYSHNLAVWHTVAQAFVMMVHAGIMRPICVKSRVNPKYYEAIWVPMLTRPAVAHVIGRLAQGLGPDWKSFYRMTPRAKERLMRPQSPVEVILWMLSSMMTLVLSQQEDAIQSPFGLTMAGLWSSAGRYPTRNPYVGADAVKWAHWMNLYASTPLKNWRPVLSVSAIKGGELSLSFGVAQRNKKGELSGSPVSLKRVLTETAWRSERAHIVALWEAVSKIVPELNKVMRQRSRPRIARESLRDFLFDAVPTLQCLEIFVRLPDSLKKILRPSLQMSDAGAKQLSKGFLNAQELLDFSWEVALGDKVLSREDFDRLCRHVGEVIPWDGQYIYLDPNEVAKLRAHLDEPTTKNAMSVLQAILTEEMDGVSVSVPEGLRRRLDRLGHVDRMEVPEGLQATLRPYQVRGYSWLVKNLQLGLGALIADDMGLGKTLQVIATITKLKEMGELARSKVLVIAPTSLLTNWQREVARFSPELTVGVYHGASRKLPEQKNLPDVLFTTYGLLRRDIRLLQKRRWRLLVLDEAQALKNDSSQQTKAVKQLGARQVIGMSGTPVENSLMDFWTLLSIVQPGLLGTSSDFRSLYQIPIEYRHDMSCAQALKRLTAPFVLRRLKSDPKIIADLPEKTTSDMYVSLLPEQAALYEKLTKQALKKMARLERAQDQKAKRGLILKLLTELKQVCNSPSQWRKRFVQAPDSGKGEVLKELVLRSIADERKVLIFTQYRRMGERLAQWLESIVGHRVPFLHGGVSIKERMRMVDDFQENRHTQVMIVSLKAGGTGLNLTAASVVIHYDLWWNPAVEAQATDRAYRIGQQKNVLVYRLISEGTYEEKLNSLLEHKRAMADATVTRGETWLGDMPLAELEDFLSLQTSVDVS